MALFGQVGTNTNNTQASSGGFGGFGTQNNTTSQPTTSLFGASAQQPAATTSSLFGQPAQQSQPTNNLFGASTQQQGNSLFGQTTQQPQQQTNSLFGQSAGQSQQQQSNGLFGQTAQQPQQQQTKSLFGQSTQQPQQQSNSLFGQPAQQPQQQGNSLFGQPAQQQQQQQPFGGSTINASQQQLTQTARAPLWQPGNSVMPRSKTIPEQMQTLFEKWSPESNNCSFQHYFYNNVQAEAVPYYGPEPGEDEQAWEEALAKKPHEGAIPVLCKGFSALGNRLKIQVQAVVALQARLHEINNSLTAMLQNHDLDISIRAVDARRRHITLSQRSLQLATKVQILRNRGYVMDRAEEDLKQKLMELERGVFDPQLSGRQEEIWARMVGIRERARFLQQELDRAGNGTGEGQGEVLDEDLVKMTKKILGDYDAQIQHLHGELEDTRKDFENWQHPAPNGR